MSTGPDAETWPDAGDGLTHAQRIVLYVLRRTERELGGGPVPTAMLYGRVLEYLDFSEAELHACLECLGASALDR